MKLFVLAASLAAAPAAASDFHDLAVGAADLRLLAAETAAPEPSRAPEAESYISEGERAAYIARAELWRPESELNPAALNFTSPPFPKAKYAVEELVTCSYIPMREAYEGGKPNGLTRKFKCRDAKGKALKVKYGEHNGEVVTEVAASWLLTAIGAYADRMYPVRVNCEGCPSDPFKSERDPGAWTQGQACAIEDKVAERMESSRDSGIGFDEFHLIEDRVGAEALAGLAMFLGNTDNKAENQALGCRKDDLVTGPDGKASCRRPVVYLQDMGISFGGRGLFHNRRMHYRKWAKEKVWDDPKACVMHLREVRTSSLKGNDASGRDMHQIGERARQLLIRRLGLLGREQLAAIFRASRAPRQEPSHSPEEWADLFLRKVEMLRRPLGDRTPPDFKCPYEIVPPNSAPPEPEPFPSY